MWADTFSQAYADMHSAENIEAYCAANFSEAAAIEILDDTGSVCKMITVDETPMGFYVLKLKACPIVLSGRSAELKQIYLLANGYGQGFGRSLFEDAIGELRARKMDWIWLSVSDANHRAQSFYKKLGFIKQGRGPIFHVGTDHLTSSILAKSLSSIPS